MSKTTISKLITEISAHPRERNGFDCLNLEKLTGHDRDKSINILIDRLAEGNERLIPPLKLITNNNFENSLVNKLKSLSCKDHGYIFISFFLYEVTKDTAYLDKMKQGIKQGDPDWEMRRSALGRNLKNCLEPSEYAGFCKDVAIIDSNISVIKTALLGIQNHFQKDKSYELNSQYLDFYSKITSSDESDRRKAITELNKITL